MTAEGLIRQLQNFIEHGLKPTAIIKAWDGDSEQFQPVSGFVYDTDSVELQTDSDEEESAVAVAPVSSNGTEPPEEYEYSLEIKSIHDRCEAGVDYFSNDDVSELLVEIDRLAKHTLAWAASHNGQGWEPKPCECVCHKVGLFGLMCCPCTKQSLDELVNGKRTEPLPAPPSEANVPQVKACEVCGETEMLTVMGRNKYACTKHRAVANVPTEEK